MEYAGTMNAAFELVAGGCTRHQAKVAMKNLASLERRMARMGVPSVDVLERVEQYWHDNDLFAKSQWLLSVGQEMFGRRRWSFFFIGWG